jgi:hypothetical protein
MTISKGNDTDNNNDEAVLHRVRERQWMYLGPILAAPIAHISVSLYRSAKTPRQKQLLVGVGIIGSTVVTLGMRMYLMYHAGYPGGDGKGLAEREKLVTLEQKRKMDKPTAAEIFRGFG